MDMIGYCGALINSDIYGLLGSAKIASSDDPRWLISDDPKRISLTGGTDDSSKSRTPFAVLKDITFAGNALPYTRDEFVDPRICSGGLKAIPLTSTYSSL
jgi:hypothetical protein